MKKMVRNRIIAAAALSSLLCGVALASSAVTTKKSKPTTWGSVWSSTART